MVRLYHQGDSIIQLLLVVVTAWSFILSPCVTLCLQQHRQCGGSETKTRRDILKDISKNILLSTSLSTILIQPFAAANALTPKEAETAYDSYAESYDELDGGKAADILGLDVARTTLFRQARGNVFRHILPTRIVSYRTQRE